MNTLMAPQPSTPGASRALPSPSACAHLTGVMSLENPRTLANKPRTVLLTAGIFIGPEPDDYAVGLLQYYNERNLNFKVDGDLFFVTAKVYVSKFVS